MFANPFASQHSFHLSQFIFLFFCPYWDIKVCRNRTDLYSENCLCVQQKAKQHIFQTPEETDFDL